jgi:hypothetical protein
MFKRNYTLFCTKGKLKTLACKREITLFLGSEPKGQVLEVGKGRSSLFQSVPLLEIFNTNGQVLNRISSEIA